MRARLTEQGAKRRGERERAVGLDAEDEAGLARGARSRASTGAVEVPLQVKELHRWRQKRGGKP